MAADLSFVTATPIALAARLQAALGFTFYSYSPTNISAVFDNLPAGVVDYDPATPHKWTPRPDQGHTIALTLLVEIYVPLVTDDGGQGTDAQLKALLENAIAAIIADHTLGGVVDDMWITASQVELISAKIEQTGQKCRWCWVKPCVKVTIAMR